MPTLSKEQEAELQRLKGYFPFRIIYGAFSPAGEWECGAATTRRTPNALARKGYTVFILK
jgi:hypothetical protein